MDMTFRSNFQDDYEHRDNRITYLIENELQNEDSSEEFNQLKDKFHSQLLDMCDCPATAKCLGSCHGENYVWNSEFKELVLNNQRKCQDLIYECNDLCSCRCDCGNRLVQFGPRLNLEIVDLSADEKGMGLRTKSKIPQGAFVCEYTGEILTKNEAIRRNVENDINHKMNYIICLNERSTSQKSKPIQTFIDPSLKGNIGRYLNHSCDPNCFIISVRFNYVIPKLGIFSLRDIESGEELTFHYGGGEIQQNCDSHNKTRCLCQTSTCTGFLPNWSYS